MLHHQNVSAMQITIIYDNTAYNSELIPDWGFAALLEAHGRRILFDTGGDGTILLNNMKKLDIDPTSVDEVFISHPHFDHVGGLSAFLHENHEVTVYVPDSLRGIKHAREIRHFSKPEKIHENFFSTGQLDQIEQALAVQTEKGLVLVVGCSHPPMEDILDTASRFGNIFGIVGGLHGFNKFELLSNLNLICPTHCTQHKTEIQNRYPDKVEQGGAGRVIKI
jgi:7,8-dihydropterin-6-yl-methyl-4-(beta-D-ribofuranosyl)aminobenzene 5'-phosphate synthase